MKVVQRLLGHKTAVLTLDRYGHLFPHDLDAVATAFDSAADALRTAVALSQSQRSEIAADQGGRCRIRTCVGVSRRIYSPSLEFAAEFRLTGIGAGRELGQPRFTLCHNASRHWMPT